MLELPDIKKAFEYENNFYLSCDTSRISKIIAQYELYKMTETVPGSIVECGIFKGTSFIRFAIFRALSEKALSKKMIGFDIFGKFPEVNYKPDKEFRQYHLDTAGGDGLSKEQLLDVMKGKKLDGGVELVEGNIIETVPAYLDAHPELKISLLNLDVDMYEASLTILKCLYPRISKGGILILDDYGVYPGETKAVREYFEGKNVEIRKMPFRATPAYIVKK